MDGHLVDMVFTDPPYNVNYGATAKDKMRSKGGAKAGRKIMNDNLGDDFEDSCLPRVRICSDFAKGQFISV